MDFKLLPLIGILLIVFGVILVTLPLITQLVPSVEKLPWIIVWIYEKIWAYFATSPLLIVTSLVSILVQLITRYR
ncbi:MAG: hypothetical protein NWE81_02405 [Candidatus Bathyarchaeota archaeon]|jgi:hypothetical protein|nr:hypothetical protein [Candidatus Bathyarchaeota archaeon]